MIISRPDKAWVYIVAVMSEEGDSPQSLPPQPRKIGGWADESGGALKGRRRREHIEDERLKVTEEDSDEDVPAIPDLEEAQEEELATLVAAPPSVAVNRVATYRQLDSDLHKHAGLFTLDGDIDLKILAKVLSPDSEIEEEDKPWEWNKLFTEVSPDIQEVWDQLKRTDPSTSDDQSLKTMSDMSP